MTVTMTYQTEEGVPVKPGTTQSAHEIRLVNPTTGQVIHSVQGATREACIRGLRAYGFTVEDE